MTSTRPKRTPELATPLSETARTLSTTSHPSDCVTTMADIFHDYPASSPEPRHKRTKSSTKSASAAAAAKSAPEPRVPQYNTAGEELFCLCHQPYDPRRFMIGCDACEGWFHAKCVNVSKSQAEASQEWTCPECIERAKTNNRENGENESKKKKKRQRTRDRAKAVGTAIADNGNGISERATTFDSNGDSYDDSINSDGALIAIVKDDAGAGGIAVTRLPVEAVKPVKSKRRRDRERERDRSKKKDKHGNNDGKKEKKDKHRIAEDEHDRKKRKDRHSDRSLDDKAKRLDAVSSATLSLTGGVNDSKDIAELYSWLSAEIEHDSSSEEERVYLTSDDELLPGSTAVKFDDLDAIMVDRYEVPEFVKVGKRQRTVRDSSKNHDITASDTNNDSTDEMVAFGELNLARRSLLSSNYPPSIESDLTLPESAISELTPPSSTSSTDTASHISASTAATATSSDLDHALLRHLHVKKMEVECCLLDLERDRRVYLAGVDFASRESVMRTTRSFHRTPEQSVLLAEADLYGEESENHSHRHDTDDSHHHSQSMFSPRVSFPFTPRTPCLARRVSLTPANSNNNLQSLTQSQQHQLHDLSAPSFPLYCTTLTCAGCDGLIPISQYADHLVSCSLAAPEADQFDWVNEVMNYLSGQWECGWPMGGEPRRPKATVDHTIQLSAVDRKRNASIEAELREQVRRAAEVDSKPTPVGTSSIRIQGLLPLPPLLHPPCTLPTIAKPVKRAPNKKHSELTGDEDHTRRSGIVHDYYNYGLNSVSGRFPLTIRHLALVCGHPTRVPAAASVTEHYIYCQRDKHECSDHLMWEELEKTSIEQRYLTLSRRLELLKSELDSVQHRVNERVMQEAEIIGNVLGDALLCERDEELEERQREEAGRDSRIATIIERDEDQRRVLHEQSKVMEETKSAKESATQAAAQVSSVAPIDTTQSPSQSRSGDAASTSPTINTIININKQSNGVALSSPSAAAAAMALDPSQASAYETLSYHHQLAQQHAVAAAQAQQNAALAQSFNLASSHGQAGYLLTPNGYLLVGGDYFANSESLMPQHSQQLMPFSFPFHANQAQFPLSSVLQRPQSQQNSPKSQSPKPRAANAQSQSVTNPPASPLPTVSHSQTSITARVTIPNVHTASAASSPSTASPGQSSSVAAATQQAFPRSNSTDANSPQSSNKNGVVTSPTSAFSIPASNLPTPTPVVNGMASPKSTVAPATVTDASPLLLSTSSTAPSVSALAALPSSTSATTPSTSLAAQAALAINARPTIPSLLAPAPASPKISAPMPSAAATAAPVNPFRHALTSQSSTSQSDHHRVPILPLKQPAEASANQSPLVAGVNN